MQHCTVYRSKRYVCICTLKPTQHAFTLQIHRLYKYKVHQSYIPAFSTGARENAVLRQHALHSLRLHNAAYIHGQRAFDTFVHYYITMRMQCVNTLSATCMARAVCTCVCTTVCMRMYNKTRIQVYEVCTHSITACVYTMQHLLSCVFFPYFSAL